MDPLYHTQSLLSEVAHGGNLLRQVIDEDEKNFDFDFGDKVVRRNSF